MLNVLLLLYITRFLNNDGRYIAVITGNAIYFLIFLFILLTTLSALFCIFGLVLFYKCYKNLDKCKLNPKLFAHMLCAICLLICNILVGTISFGLTKMIQLNWHDGFQKAMLSYASNINMKISVDRLQIRHKCCGHNNFQDWFRIPWIRTEIGSIVIDRWVFLYLILTLVTIALITNSYLTARRYNGKATP